MKPPIRSLCRDNPIDLPFICLPRPLGRSATTCVGWELSYCLMSRGARLYVYIFIWLCNYIIHYDIVMFVQKVVIIWYMYVLYKFVHFRLAFLHWRPKTNIFLIFWLINSIKRTARAFSILKTKKTRDGFCWVKTKYYLKSLFCLVCLRLVQFSRCCLLFSMWPNTSMVVGIKFQMSHCHCTIIH